MLAKLATFGAAIAAMSLTAEAQAVTVYVTGLIDSCTPTCDSFTFLDEGSTIKGFIVIDDAALADGTWDGGDVTDLSFTVFNPAAPPFGPSNPPDPVVDNPFTLDTTPVGGALVVANGAPITNLRGTFPPCEPGETLGCVITSAGTYDGFRLDSGVMDLWLTQGLLAANGAVIHLDFAAGTVTVNVFENLVLVADGRFANDPPDVITIIGLAINATHGRCVNLTTGQVMALPAQFGKAVLCEAAGFEASTGDAVEFVVAGSEYATGQLGASARGVNVETITCANLTTGQVVGFHVPDHIEWPNCVLRGLVLSPGDLVSVKLSGTAQ